MALRNIDNAIKTALANRDPLLVYHLVKFEKPSQLALEAEKAIDYVYLTDAPYAVTYEGQEYHPGGLLKVGKVPESTEAKATNLSLTLSTTKLGKQSGVITVSTSGIAASADGELTVNLDLFKSGFYPGDVVRFDPTNSGTAFTVRINRLHSDGTKIAVTNLGTNAISSISNVTYRANFDSSEVDALTSGGAVTVGGNTTFSSTSFDNYINRSVSIFRVFSNPATGAQIGTPVLLFKGIIAKGTLNEKVQGPATMTWSLTSHWGDFVRINGRITSDEFHRGLDSSGNSSEDAAIRPEYVDDLGFAHADSSLNVLASYTDIATRGKNVRRGGLAGLLGGKKYKEEKYEVTRELDLSINLDAKYIPLVYGVQRVDPIPVFADVIITQDANSEDNVASGQTDLFQAQVLCEGPIGGVYDIYMEDKGLVCKDDQDGTARTGSSSDIPCLGRMDRGTVLSGQQLYSGLLQNNEYGTTEQVDDADFWRGSNINWIQGTVRGPNASFQNSRTGTDGILHGESFRFPAAKNIQLTVHTGKEDQEVDQTLFGIANAKDFLVQQNYFTDDKTKYWTANHRLLDSAYVVTRDTITAEDGRSPSLSFVVRGKFINCHSYDGSYKIAQGVHTSLELGDTATITLADGSSGGTAQVIDKWYFVNASKVTEHRMRFGFFNTPATETAILNNTVGKFTAAKAGSASITFISPEYSNNTSAPVAPTTPLTFAGFVFAGSNFTNKSIALQRIVSTVTTQVPIYGGSIGEPEIVGFTDVVRKHFKYTLNFSALPAFTQNALKVAKEASHLVEITLTANSNTKTINISASELDSSTMIYTFTGLSGELESLFGNPGGTAGTTNATATDVSFVNRRMLLQNASDSLNPTDANGLTIEVTQEDIVSDTFSVKTPTTSALQTFCNSNNILPLNKNLPTRFTVTSAKYAYGVQGSHLDVEQFGDFRVSINPAMQLLDYLTSDRYGKGLKIGTDLDLDSFKEVARSCDTRSNVTLMFPSTVSVSAEDQYRYPATGTLLWQGTVESSSTVQYVIGSTQYSYTQVVFKDCIGKLGRKWNSWYPFETNELVWTNGGYWNIKGASNLAKPTSASTSTVNLRKVGSSTDIALETSLETNIGNPFVKQVTGTGAAAKIISGYSLYDSDDVKYWKYVGWDNLDQRFVTRHQTNATIDTSQSLFDNVNSMLRQFNAILRYSNGKYFLDQRVKAKPITQFGFDETITDDDIIGDIKIADKGIQKTFNSVNAQIIDPSNSFEPRSIAFYNSEYKKQDKNIPRQGSFEAPGISNYFNARMNIKQTLDESRAGLDISFTMSPRGYLLLAGNLIAITNERFNWVKKLFRIENLNTRDDLLVDVVAKEHNDNAYLVEAPPSDLVIQYNTGADAKPPVKPLPPSNLSATNNGGGGIELNWTNASNYKDASHTIEIYRSANTNWANRKLVGTTKGDSFTDQILNTGAQQRYYWIRYSIQSPRPGTQSIETINSAYHPLTTGTGVSGNAISITTDELDTGVTVNDGGITFPNSPSGDPVIKAGITSIDAGSAGFFFGREGGSYKFQVGDPSASNFKFDGTNLSLTGSQFSVAAPGATTPSISGTSLSGKGSLLKADGDVFFGDASGFNIFFDASAGTLTLTGQMVTENNITTNAITADKIAANAINANKIAANSIDADKIAANTITADMITSNSVVSSLITASTVNSAHIKANSIVSTIIDATSITANDISTATLSALSADLGDVTAGTMKGGSIPDANAAPGGSETGAFMDLTNGKMVFGNANKHILFDGTNLVLSGVTIDANSIVNANAPLGVKEDGTSEATNITNFNFTSGLNLAVSGTEATVSLDTPTDNNFTNAEKTKLTGIATNANNFSLPTAASNTLGGVKIGSRLTIDSGGVLSANLQSDNNFTTALLNKLNAVEAGATADQTAAEIRTLVNAATDSNVFTDADHTKLNNIETGATGDQTAAEIRTLVEAATDSNVFTDADHTKLNSVASNANNFVLPNNNVTNASVSGSTLTLTRQGNTSVTFTNTDTTFSAGSGLSLSGTTFSVDSTVVRTTGTQSIAGTKTFTGDVTFSGTTTYINTQTLNIGDNIITLNADYTGSSPSQNAGIEIGRGSATNKTLLWDEGNDKWTVGSETFVAGTFEGSIAASNITGSIVADGFGSLTTDDLPQGTTNKYFSNSLARSAISGSTGISYNSTTGAITNSAPANNATITLNAGTDLITGGDFTTNQSSNETITINHANISRTNNTSSASPGYGGTFTVIDSITSSARGHITAVNTKTVTIPASDNTDTNTVTQIREDSGSYRTGNITLQSGTNVTITEPSTGVFNFASTDTNTTNFNIQASGGTSTNISAGETINYTGGGATTVSRSGNTITISSTDTNTDTNTVTQIREDTGSYRTGNITLSSGTNVSIVETSTGVFQFNSTDTNTNYFLNGISRSGNTLTFSVSGATNQSYTFGSNAFTSTTIPSAANNATITLNAGNGLTTGGAFTTDQDDNETINFHVGAGTGITVNANDVALSTAGPGAGSYGSTADDTKIDQITLDAYGRVTAVSTGPIDTNAGTVTSVSTGVGLDGTITSSGTISLDLSELTSMNAQTMTTSDEFIVLDSGAERKISASDVISDLNIVTGNVTGTLFADIIVANNITTQMLTADVITANEIAANAVRAEQIQVAVESGAGIHMKLVSNKGVIEINDGSQVRVKIGYLGT